MSEFVVSSMHTVDLANGAMVNPGATVKLSSKDQEEPHNKRLIEEGTLIPREATSGKKEDDK